MNRKMKEACAAVADIFEALPEMWTPFSYAIDANGRSVYGDDHAACKWCAAGGIMAAMNMRDGQVIFDALNPFGRNLGYDTAGDANDKGGRIVAIKMLRMAAES